MRKSFLLIILFFSAVFSTLAQNIPEPEAKYS